MSSKRFGQLEVSVAASNAALGSSVAAAFASAARDALSRADTIAVILATGNSQLSFARAVVERGDIEWGRITVMHMDEYLRMDENHPASFRRWMQERIVSQVSPRAFEGIRGDHPVVEEELERYSALLRDLAPAITVMGIGENGHLAFNDPPAQFETSDLIRVVALDARSRQQQVDEKHFASLDETPRRAMSLTIPALLSSGTVLVGVPEARKAEAVRAALQGPVTPECPASILRSQLHAHLFLDEESAELLSEPGADTRHGGDTAQRQPDGEGLA